MIIHVNGIDLYYEVVGEGRPLLMVHGNGEEHSIFTEAAEILRDQFTCYLIDSRDHGQSTPVEKLHYDDMAKDMIAFIEALELQDVAFYGFSDGGIIGLLAGAECDRITDLIVSGSNTKPSAVKLWLWLIIKLTYIFKKDRKMELMLKEPNISDETLKKIKARTLVLAGSKDVIKEEETRHIASVIPGAELRILEGEGHGSYIVHQTKVGEIIRDFIAKG